MSEHLPWIVSRGAGIAALLLASGAVALGLLMSGRMAKGWQRDLRPLHEALSLATLAALALHALALLGDGYLSPSLADITVPFVFDYEPLWTGVGVIAGWLLVALGLSFYARARIGVARWRVLHRFTALAWLHGRRAQPRLGHGRRPLVVPGRVRDRDRADARPARPAPDARAGTAP